MQIFISSLISGMEDVRAAARRVVEVLRHQPVMAEDFGARASSPQVACLSGLRQSDLVVLILGDRYGARQPSGLSATHEEYRAARGVKPVLVFLQDGIAPEPEQAAFIDEVSGWESGHFRAGFSNAQDLADRLTRALHDYELAHQRAPLDAPRLGRRAVELLPPADGNQSDSCLHLAIAAGPEATVLRPAQLEDPALARTMRQHALFGPSPIFDDRQGTDSRLEDHALVVFQGDRYTQRAEVRLWSTGDIRLILPFGDRDSRRGGLPVVIEEDVSEQFASALAYAAWLLGHVDPIEAVTHVALAARIAGRGAMGWRTRAEHAASPNSGSFGSMWNEQGREQPVQLAPAHVVRQALVMAAPQIVSDLTVLLRRRWNS